MKKFIKQIKNQNYNRRLQLFKNSWKDKDVLILSCGPSLNEFSREQVEQFSKDKLVICIKESVMKYGNICDIHFFNEYRRTDYKYSDEFEKPFIILQTWKKYGQINEDLQMQEVGIFNPKIQLMVKKNFQDFLIENNPKRPWGPGILFESVFYFCDWIGAKNVYTIGFDLSPNNGKLPHFFDNEDQLKYKNVKQHNESFSDEMIYVNKNVPFLYDFFLKRGMNIIVVGEQSHVNRKIPRLKTLMNQ